MDSDGEVFDEEAWSRFFNEVSSLLQELDRQYGIGNLSYVYFALDRLEVCLSSLRLLSRTINEHVDSTSYAERLLTSEVQELIMCLRVIRARWLEYRQILQSSDATRFAYRVGVSSRQERGRPRFVISREQLEYLWSLSFSWSEVAALLGVSRSTLYRYCVQCLSWGACPEKLASL